LLDYLGGPGQNGVRLVLEPDLAAQPVPKDIGDAVEIAVGPEGGFAEDELDAFRIAGFDRVRLGPRILRTETAAIAALTCLQARFGDMGAGLP
jgi:16S rRNA (uracil1498-N3)-methyltransferase